MEEKELKEKLEELESELSDERTEWNKIISGLASRIKDELKTAIQLEAEAVSRRQEVTEMIGNYSYEINKYLPTYKKAQKKCFEKYATSYQIKVNATERKMVMEADLAFGAGKIKALENHIQFLIESRKTVDHVIWSVKNKIQLYNITEMYG
jgi:hypothetical protein